MLEAGELARLQRAIDGLSSPGSSEPSSPTDFFREAADPKKPISQDTSPSATSQQAEQPVGIGVPSNATEDKEGGNAIAAPTFQTKVVSEDDEEFDIRLLLKQRNRQRRQGVQENEVGKEQPVALPPVDVALDEGAERVRRRQAQREEEAAARAARHAGNDVTHVSASGPRGGSRGQAKKQQQVYVGLPVGVGWHVPLVGVEGRGGYKSADGAEGEGNGGTEKKTNPLGQKRPLTVKEREKLKREKGQSSHATWKPETWMQLRQQFD